MPVREIKTTLSLDGEKQFKQELADARKEMRVMNADLKAMAAEFDSTGDEQRYFSQRVDALNEKVKQQDEIVKALNKAVKDSAEKYGEAASKTQDYRIQLSNATAQMFKLRKEAEEAQRDLDDLGRGTRKAGREIKEGIGDNAEAAAGKLESMFDKMVGDVNTMKSSVAWSTTMSVGEFVFDAIESVMGFVQENQEYNRRLAQAKSVVEMYGFNADEIVQIAKEAASVTGDFEGALDAMVNLSAAGFDNEEQIRAAMKSLLGVWLSSSGTLDFSGLAEDYLESVKEKTPTGTYAEAITKFTNRSVEDVQKVLESMKSHADTLEVATAILTEAGLQTKVEDYTAKNAEIVNAEMQNIEIAEKWAKIARMLQPYTTGVQSVINEILGEIITFIDDNDIKPKAGSFLERIQIAQQMKKEAEKLEREGNTEAAETAKKTLESYKKFGGALEAADFFSSIFNAPREWFANTFGGTKYKHDGGKGITFDTTYGIMDWILPSAGAEEMPELQQFGEDVMQEIKKGMTTTMGDTSAIGAAIKTDIAMMRSESVMEEANAAGYDLMVSFGNGIAEGAGIPIKNVRDMINQINAELNAIATPAYGLGWSGMSGGNIALYMDGQKVGQLSAGGVNTALGRKVDAKMMIK